MEQHVLSSLFHLEQQREDSEETEQIEREKIQEAEDPDETDEIEAEKQRSRRT